MLQEITTITTLIRIKRLQPRLLNGAKVEEVALVTAPGPLNQHVAMMMEAVVMDAVVLHHLLHHLLHLRVHRDHIVRNLGI